MASTQDWFLTQAQQTRTWRTAVNARRIDYRAALAAGIGYAPDSWTALIDHLQAQGHSPEALITAGVATRTRRGTIIDAFRGRVTFPLHDNMRNVVGWTGRDTTNNHPAKYLNTRTSQLFNKQAALYGATDLHTAECIVITEGPWDAAAITYATQERHIGVAAVGTAFTHHHARQLARTNKPIIIWMDPDPAGQAGTHKAFQALAAAGITDITTTTTTDLDPSDYYQTKGGPAITHVLTNRTRPAAQVLIDQALPQRPSDPIQAISLARQLVALIINSPKQQRGHLANHLATRTGLMPTTVVQIIADAQPIQPRTNYKPPTPPTRFEQSGH